MSVRGVIAGDVGGTNTRLAIINRSTVTRVERYANARLDGLESALADYLVRQSLAASDFDLMLAVAAPVIANRAVMTNLDWEISAARLAARFGFARVVLVNDFFALAHAVPAFGEEDTIAIGAGQPVDGAPALIIGPGTGFGAGIWLPSGIALATEAGHALIAHTNAAEARVLEDLAREFGPVSVERVVSGPGLVNLHRMLSSSAPDTTLSPAAIAARATQTADAEAASALALFFAFLGIAARDLALSTGARGGVYLAGGILPRYADALACSEFRARFETPAPLPGYLESIATRLVVHPEPALLGLASYFTRVV